MIAALLLRLLGDGFVGFYFMLGYFVDPLVFFFVVILVEAITMRFYFRLLNSGRLSWARSVWCSFWSNVLSTVAGIGLAAMFVDTGWLTEIVPDDLDITWFFLIVLFITFLLTLLCEFVVILIWFVKKSTIKEIARYILRTNIASYIVSLGTLGLAHALDLPLYRHYILEFPPY